MEKIIKVTGLLIISFIIELNAAYAYIANPKERIAFWRENYKTLSQNENPHVETAHAIFNKIVNAAGNRSRISPMLHIVQETPKNIQLPIAIPDGWVIISAQTLEFAYEDKTRGDDILAFILAHEIAHLMEDDFWHMKFFQAIDLSRHNTNEKQLLEIQRLAAQSNKIIAKELRADEKGLTFAAIAGFNTHLILDINDSGNFFNRWINRFSSSDKTVAKNNKTHPSPEQRELALHSRLNQIHQQSQLFNLGLWLYQAGDFDAAKAAFKEFRHYFPGRAVNHNIALSYHQLALQAKQHINLQEFRTTLSLDPYTYAAKVDRNKKSTNTSYSELLEKAIEFYELAISQDNQYLIAYNNLASAYLEKNQPYKAIGLLKEAIKYQPENTKLLNNLAISFYRADNKDKTRGLLKQAHALNQDNTDILYNLGLLNFLDNNNTLAENYWNQFLLKEPYSGWSKHVCKLLGKSHKLLPSPLIKTESINNIQVGNYLDEIPDNWKVIESYLLELNRHSYKVARYHNGILSVSEEDEISYIIADIDYRGKTNNGIKINDPISNLLSRYGAPSETQHSSSGQNMVYRNSGISFQVDNNKIKSWLLFRG